MKENLILLKFNPLAEILYLEDTIGVFLIDGLRNTFKHPHAKQIINFFKKYFHTYQTAPEDEKINKLINVFVDNGLLFARQQNPVSIKIGLLALSIESNSIENVLAEINASSERESLIEFEILNLEKLDKNLENFKKNDFIFVVTRPGEYFQLHQINEFFLKHKINWVWGVVSENYFQIGPFFKGAENFCFECFHSRSLAQLVDYELELKILSALNEYKKTKMQQFDVSKMMLKLFLDQIREIYHGVSLEKHKITILSGCFEYRGADQNFEKFYLLGNPSCKACQNDRL